MPSTEIFPNSLVKQVIFAAQFPNLFFLEGLIGQFQSAIMGQFPSSQLLIRRSLLLTEGDQKRLAELSISDDESQKDTKVWQFESEEGVTLGLTTSTLSLTSNSHKTYNLGDGKRFRDVIEFTCNEFLRLTGIPKILRLGLRYVNECPIFENTTASFKDSYDSTLPVDRFPIESVSEMHSQVVSEQLPYRVRHIERIASDGSVRKLVLDFDAWAERVPSGGYLETTDALHEIIWNEFSRTIREPVLAHMRQPIEVKK